MNKILVTGMGRSGTSLLMAIFTRMGLDTGFNENDIKEIYEKEYHAGLEDFRKSNYIIKRPAPNDCGILFFNKVYDLLIVTVRNLTATANSRERVHKLGFTAGGRPGDNKDNLNQYNYNAKAFGELMAHIALNDIPHVFLKFPLFAKDFDYFWNVLSKYDKLITPNTNKEIAHKAWEQSVRPDFIHF